MRKGDFPKVIRVGQTKATIYKTPSHDCDSLTVVWYEGTVRKRKSFSDLAAAELHARSQVNSLSRGEAEAVRLTGEQRLAYTRSCEAVKEFGLSLDTVAMEYRDAKRLVRGGSLVEAARYYAAQRLLDIPKKTVADVYAEMIKAKRAEGLSERYIQDLESRVGKFSREFPKLIAAVSGVEIKTWLQNLTREGVENRKKQVSVSNRTRNNFRLGIQTLFSFAKSQQYLPLDWNGMESVPVWKMKEEAVEIFTADELIQFLAYAPENMITFLTIGAFAGLRSAEIERLDWAKVNLETGYITVDAGIAKTNSRRLVPITANLKAWLKDRVKARGKVVELSNVPNAIQRLVESMRPIDPEDPLKRLEAPVPWKQNALRHSFCSYRLAEVKSAAQVSLEAGNGPQMIFKHYRELVTEKEAHGWFAITPESIKAAKAKAEQQQAAKIVAFPAKAA